MKILKPNNYITQGHLAVKFSAEVAVQATAGPTTIPQRSPNAFGQQQGKLFSYQFGDNQIAHVFVNDSSLNHTQRQILQAGTGVKLRQRSFYHLQKPTHLKPLLRPAKAVLSLQCRANAHIANALRNQGGLAVGLFQFFL